MVIKTLGKALNIVHLILLFSPIWLFLIPLSIIKKNRVIFRFYFLIMILIPIHWVFLDGECIFTKITIIL